ncbi:MAG TPA: 5-deoxy-glucuronate isomerase [Propionibacteriaceae bacterium]|nr:5-deoxy-glucuronate isomerase [Propionibacteriaceae bacterium]
MESRYLLRSGFVDSGPYEVEVTPESAGWGYSSLKIISLEPEGSHRFDTGSDEVIVLPLNGSVAVNVDDARCELEGRPSVFDGPTDLVYVGPGKAVTLRSSAGGRFAFCAARAQSALPLRYLAASQVPVELRGAGQSSRQVRNFGTPGSLEAAKIIACEVITPAGNWSSYPAHKHDETTETESELEEIYYFEIAAGPNGQPGFGFMRTSSSPGREIEVLEEVHDRDTVLVPYGWHGPCVAAPGFDMYYLNVMAGPGAERVWKISDHPDQAWVRDTWETQSVDPRLLSETVQEA